MINALITLRNILIILIVSNSMYSQKYTLIDTSYQDIFSDLYISKKCAGLINENNFDELKKVANKWNAKGVNEPSQRLKLLLSLRSGNYFESEPNDIIKNMLIYRAIQKGSWFTDTIYYLPFAYVSGYPKINDSFNEATVKLAKSIYNNKKYNLETRLISGFYSNSLDSVFVKIQNLDKDSSFVRSQYYQYVRRMIRDSFRIKFGLFSGIWMPTGNLSVLGNHSSLGFTMGMRGFNGWGIDLSMCQRFGNLSDSIELEFKDTARFSNRYLGAFFGLDISKNIFTSVKHEIDLMAGIALDGFNSTYDLPNDTTYTEASINSLNFNFGISYRFVIKQTTFVDVQLKYHFINYDSNGLTDLSGNAITINIGVGVLSGGKVRMAILNALEYKYY